MIENDWVRARWIDLRRYLKAFWLLTAFFFTVAAYLILSAPPVYSTSVQIFPKDAGGASAGLLGGAVGASLGLGQNVELVRFQLLLTSEEIADRVGSENPDILKRVRKSDAAPETNKAEWVEAIRGLVSVKPDSRGSYLEVMVKHSDPDFTVRLLNAYLQALNVIRRSSAQDDLRRNREFLAELLKQETDPQVQIRIQSLIGAQLERALYLSATTFDVPVPPRLPLEPSGPNRVIGLLVGAVVSMVGAMVTVTLAGFIRGRRRN